MAEPLAVVLVEFLSKHRTWVSIVSLCALGLQHSSDKILGFANGFQICCSLAVLCSHFFLVTP
jgi:hypothetical protein